MGSGHVVKRGDGGWSIDDLALESRVRAVSPATSTSARDHLANGELSFEAKNLDDLSPLVLMKLGGALQAKIVASVADGRQAIAVVANSDRMSVGDNRLEGLKVDMTVGDVWGARSVDGSAKLSRAEIAGQSVSDIRIMAKPGADASDLDVGGVVRGLVVKARGRLFGGSPIRLDLSALSAEGHGRRIALAGPAQLSYGDGGLDVRNLALAVDSGRVAVSGHAGDRLDLKATADRGSARSPRSRGAGPRPLGRRSTARRRSAGPATVRPATGVCALTAGQRAAASRRGPPRTRPHGLRTARRRADDAST